MKRISVLGALWTACFCAISLPAQTHDTKQPRYVVVDEDTYGPGGSDMAALLVLLQSSEVHVLGITVPTGDTWRDREMAHALRLLEEIGRTDIRVYPGAAFPLIRTEEWTRLASLMYGKAHFQGPWEPREAGTPWNEIPPMPEGAPRTKAAEEDAAHFMVRMVHQYPHQVTIYAAGPLTDIALAIRLDPYFAELAQEIVLMGGSLNPQTDAPEWATNPRHEFNFWFDPEAASITLKANWHKITVTTIDVSLKTRMDPEVLDGLKHATSPAARYMLKYNPRPMKLNYLWDEMTAAAWIDPSIITAEREVYMDVDVGHGATYGDTLIWEDNLKPALPLQKVHAQTDVDLTKLQQMLIRLFSAPTPGAHP